MLQIVILYLCCTSFRLQYEYTIYSIMVNVAELHGLIMKQSKTTNEEISTCSDSRKGSSMSSVMSCVKGAETSHLRVNVASTWHLEGTDFPLQMEGHGRKVRFHWQSDEGLVQKVLRYDEESYTQDHVEKELTELFSVIKSKRLRLEISHEDSLIHNACFRAYRLLTHGQSFLNFYPSAVQVLLPSSSPGDLIPHSCSTTLKYWAGHADWCNPVQAKQAAKAADERVRRKIIMPITMEQ